MAGAAVTTTMWQHRRNCAEQLGMRPARRSGLHVTGYRTSSPGPPSPICGLSRPLSSARWPSYLRRIRDRCLHDHRLPWQSKPYDLSSENGLGTRASHATTPMLPTAPSYTFIFNIAQLEKSNASINSIDDMDAFTPMRGAADDAPVLGSVE